jgi:hypothetical protein
MTFDRVPIVEHALVDYLARAADAAQPLAPDAALREGSGLTARKAIELVSHEGEEFLEVMQGRLEFHLGRERLEMAPGDTLHFDAATPHMGRALGNTPAHLLMVHTVSGAATQAPPAFRALRDMKPAANLSARRRA